MGSCIDYIYHFLSWHVVVICFLSYFELAYVLIDKLDAVMIASLAVRLVTEVSELAEFALTKHPVQHGRSGLGGKAKFMPLK